MAENKVTAVASATPQTFGAIGVIDFQEVSGLLYRA
jgi:hypothetical protein